MKKKSKPPAGDQNAPVKPPSLSELGSIFGPGANEPAPTIPPRPAANIFEQVRRDIDAVIEAVRKANRPGFEPKDTKPPMPAPPYEGPTEEHPLYDRATGGAIKSGTMFGISPTEEKTLSAEIMIEEFGVFPAKYAYSVEGQTKLAAHRQLKFGNPNDLIASCGRLRSSADAVIRASGNIWATEISRNIDRWVRWGEEKLEYQLAGGEAVSIDPAVVGTQIYLVIDDVSFQQWREQGLELAENLRQLEMLPVSPQEIQGRGLTVDEKNSTATLHGKVFPLNADQTAYLKNLIDAHGGWWAKPKGSEMRPDRIRQAMPEEISSLIESGRGPGKGSRLKI